ncbi:ATP-binding protein [Nevskia sp.]|uniref:hybrid sensor histidine kinase/response regulator n=1 Tax=Nevskia sp. TaxID=1929292 RepID=UPI0025FA19B8|nr:ATP-binding protein [Nevskia sp.]
MSPSPTTSPSTTSAAPQEQRIIKIRRDYNTWVANETLEDYALRFTARSARKWSEFRVANTAFGAISFLLLEAIGGSLLVSYGFTNTVWAIAAVSMVIFLTGLPISWYAAKYGVDMDLLTRGAGFGYIGSTITSLIYASFTFLFFALEATIMALALKLCFGIPLTPAYLICALVVIPLVTHGITLISRLQAWTQPLWLVLLVLPFIFVMVKAPELARELPDFAAPGGSTAFSLIQFGAAASVLMAMITQIGEQVDFLRFLPEKTQHNRKRWMASLIFAGPGWIGMGAIRLIGGAFLAFIALRAGVPQANALEPTEMYRIGFGYVFDSPAVALGAMTLLVVLSQLKINVTNAYAGSLAWSNFFARVTHSHPGRVVWVVFNVAIALILMQLGVFKALEQVLGLYSNVAIAWVGAIVADLVINKPLGLSPPGIEFKRAHLYDINPVGVGSMLIASVLSITAFTGVFGPLAQAFSSFIALVTAFVCAPLIAYATQGRYYLARQPDASLKAAAEHRCVICEKVYEREDMALCPAYRGNICSLCCSLDARCHDACKPGASLREQIAATLAKLLPKVVSARLDSRLGHYLLLLTIVTGVLTGALALIWVQESSLLVASNLALHEALGSGFLKLYAVLVVIAAVLCWWLVLNGESRRVAQEESNRQTSLLMHEIDAHRKTDIELQAAKLAADRANQAKSRYVTGISHELRTPLNSILGYAEMLDHDPSIPVHRRDAVAVIRRSGDHLLSLVDGLLDIARIESGKLALEIDELRFPEFLNQTVGMFRLQAHNKGINFAYDEQGKVPAVVRADKKRLGQILINIVGNAVKFTEAGGVNFRLRWRGDIATFEVRDSGIGIPADEIERIFQPFERGSMASARGETGTGLGLTIAKMLTSLMGGEMTVESTPGTGSRFEIRLFLPEVREPRAALPATMPEINGYAGPRRKILVVDNEAVDRRFLFNVLEPLGFELSEAASGIEALRMVPHVRPDLVLLDIGMPGIDGWETARLLRAHHESRGEPQLPIIVISADAFESGRDAGAGIAPRDYLLKPVSVTTLLGRIRAALNLVWIAGAPNIDGNEPPLPEHLVQPLRDLGALGHVRGILDKLDEIDRIDTRYRQQTERLRNSVKAFQLSDYLRALGAEAK